MIWYLNKSYSTNAEDYAWTKAVIGKKEVIHISQNRGIVDYFCDLDNVCMWSYMLENGLVHHSHRMALSGINVL